MNGGVAFGMGDWGPMLGKVKYAGFIVCSEGGVSSRYSFQSTLSSCKHTKSGKSVACAMIPLLLALRASDEFIGHCSASTSSGLVLVPMNENARTRDEMRRNMESSGQRVGQSWAPHRSKIVGRGSQTWRKGRRK